jgi:hypothetical protein
LDDPAFSAQFSYTRRNLANLVADVSFGDLLLYVNRPDQRELQWMRNYEGREKLVPTRMLWPLKYPFSM